MEQSQKALVVACSGYCGRCTDYPTYTNNDEKLKRLPEAFLSNLTWLQDPKTLDTWKVSRPDTPTLVQAVLSNSAQRKKEF